MARFMQYYKTDDRLIERIWPHPLQNGYGHTLASIGKEFFLFVIGK